MSLFVFFEKQKTGSTFCNNPKHHFSGIKMIGKQEKRENDELNPTLDILSTFSYQPNDQGLRKERERERETNQKIRNQCKKQMANESIE